MEYFNVPDLDDGKLIMFLSLLFYVIAFLVGLFILRQETVICAKPLFAVILSLIGHGIGTYFYSLIPSDSVIQFFLHAQKLSSGNILSSSGFTFYVVWLVRHYLTGDSILQTFYFFSAIAFVGSVLWYVLYIRCMRFMGDFNPNMFFPAFILMCWPSFLLFTSGMGKDSLCYTLIPLVFILYQNIYQKRKIVRSFVAMIPVLFVLTFFRPYLLMIFMMSFYLYAIPSWKDMRVSKIGFLLITLGGLLYVMSWVLKLQGHISSFSLSTIAQTSANQQGYQSTGTFFYMPSISPLLRLLLLPYSFLMNLCFPLFIYARNNAGLIASFENLFLVMLLILTFKHRYDIKKIISAYKPVKLFFIFFLLGIAFIAIVNTNLGLAMRQKSMYLPCFLVLFAVLYTLLKNKKSYPSVLS